MKEELQVEETQVVEEDRVEAASAEDAENESAIQDFITNMYEKGLYTQYDFLETHCSKAFLQYLKDQYEYDGRVEVRL